MRWILSCIVCFLLPLFAQSQDTVKYTKDFTFYDGIYLSYQDFRYNWPIPKSKIITKINKNQLDFYSKLIEEPYIEYIERDSSIQKVSPDRVWGYCQNNVIFINYQRFFYRVTVFGNISHFLATVETNTYSSGYDPFMNAPINSTPQKTREIKQFLLDFYSGDLVPFTVEQAEEYFQRDSVIYNEFSVLSKKKKKALVVRYIRMYNDRHPIYFPKG